MNSSHETILEVDLKKLESNFNYLSSKLKENCKIIAVVKALWIWTWRYRNIQKN